MPSDRVQTIFRIVVVAAILSAFFQVTLGGVVRVTDSGLGCPDWPLCHGQIVPPFDTPTLIEYSHRLSGSVLGLLVIANLVIVWTRFRSNRVAFQTSVAALALVIVAGVLGGVTVLTELDPRFVPAAPGDSGDTDWLPSVRGDSGLELRSERRTPPPRSTRRL